MCLILYLKLPIAYLLFCYNNIYVLGLSNYGVRIWIRNADPTIKKQVVVGDKNKFPEARMAMFKEC
jgi:hypothetical protein